MNNPNENVLALFETLEGVSANVSMCQKLAEDYIRDPVLIQKLKNINLEFVAIAEHILSRLEMPI